MNQDILKENVTHLLQSKKISRVISGHWSYKSHGEHIYNQTLFEEYAWIPYSPNMDFIFLRYTIEIQLEVTLKTLEKYIEVIQDNSIFYDALIEKKHLLELVLLSLPYELQKAWYDIEEKKIEKNKRQKRISEIEKLIWGRKVSEHMEEFWPCIRYLKEKYQLNKHKLLNNEIWLFENSLKKIEKYCEYDKNDEESENWVRRESVLRDRFSQEFFHKFGMTLIKREDYIEIFRKSLEVYGMQDMEIQSWNGGNISITKDTFLIPESSSYNFLTLQRILCLIYHEIAIHGVTWKNQKRFFGSLRGSQYYEKEEGLASYLEARLLGYNNESANTSLCAHSRILAWEILSGKEYWDFIHILRILTRQKTGSVKKSFLRNKIYQSHTDAWATRKETAYLRGFEKLKSYIDKKKDIRLLLLGKLSFEQCEQLWGEHLSDPKFVKPFSLSDYLIYHLGKKYFPPENISHYSDYLERKYPDIGNMFRNIDELEEQKQRRLEELLNLLTHIIYKSIYPWK